jgi:hypothetical protein
MSRPTNAASETGTLGKYSALKTRRTHSDAAKPSPAGLVIQNNAWRSVVHAASTAQAAIHRAQRVRLRVEDGSVTGDGRERRASDRLGDQ